MIPDCVLLEGAPDALIGTPAAKSKAVQVMHLEMNNDILDELLECIRKGKAPQVLFGKTPVSGRPLPEISFCIAAIFREQAGH